MLDLDLLKNLLIISLSSSIITTELVQKFKIYLPSNKYIIILNGFISFVFGTLFTLNFSEILMPMALWVGLFTFIGADTIYLAFEEKIFKKFSSNFKTDEIIVIKRSDID